MWRSANRYLETSVILKTMRGLLFLGIIGKNLRNEYRASKNAGLKIFEDRMRNAFAKRDETNLRNYHC